MATANPEVQAFFDPATHTVSYVAWDRSSGSAVVIDPVTDYDPAAGRMSTAGVDRLIDWVREQGLAVDWILDTHIHADHLTAVHHVRAELGGQVGIGREVTGAQRLFGELFDAEPQFAIDGSQFDVLLDDDQELALGTLRLKALHTPGHTPGCMSFLLGDAVFVGDTLFMPDYGTARCDFPGGDARQLYRSVQRLYALPPATRMFLCHDYLPDGREQYCWQTTVAEQKQGNIHVHSGVAEDEFVSFRRQRDRGLGLPALILPAVQFNMRAGCLPPAADNGIAYLKIPLNHFGSDQ